MPSVKMASKRSVYGGTNLQTAGLKSGNNLKKADLTKITDLITPQNPRGKVVNKNLSEKSKAAYQGSKLQKWSQAMKQARQKLGLTGFVPCEPGTEFYERTYDIFETL